MKAAVLFISPHQDDARWLSQMLRPLLLAVDHIPRFAEARNTLARRQYRVILTEAGLPDGSWLDVMSLGRELAPGAAVIVTDAHADASFWAEALNLGAYDLLAQPFHESEVRRILSNACSRRAPGQTAGAAL
jgi:DNA-binding NtrC family response regulator